MVTATVITFRQTQRIDNQGQLERALVPVVTGPFVSGQLELDPIPSDEFSRELVTERVLKRVNEMVPEDVEVEVVIETLG